MRLAPIPGAKEPGSDSGLVGELPRGAPYRLSLQAAIWHRESLLGLLRDGETPWDLEIEGSTRTSALERPFYSVLEGAERPLSYFATALVRGVWLRDAVALCRREGVAIDLDARPVEPRREYVRRVLRRYASRLPGRDS